VVVGRGEERGEFRIERVMRNVMSEFGCWHRADGVQRYPIACGNVWSDVHK